MTENKKKVGVKVENDRSQRNLGTKEDKYLSDDNSQLGNASERSSMSERNIEKYGRSKFNRSKSSQNFENSKRNIRRDNYHSRSNSRSPNRNFRKNTGIKHKVTNLISEKNSSKIFFPGFDGPLVSLALFSELQHNILPNDVIENAYKEYKEKFDEKRFKTFYVEHSNDEWFKEKYDPECSKQFRKERNSQSLKLCERFLENLVSNHFKNLKLELRESDENNRNIKIYFYGYNSEKGDFEEKERELNLTGNSNLPDAAIDICSQPYFGFDPDKLTLFAYQIPKTISRFHIINIVKKLPGFISMSMSEPIKNQNYCRYCWFTFDSEENCELAFDSLNDYKVTNDYKLFPIKSKSTTSKKLRVTPPCFEERIVEDLEYSKTLIQIYDRERSIEGNTLLENKDSRSKEYQLDLQVLYLRRVHGFCYYCLEEHEDERLLTTRCDNIHLRHYQILSSRNQETLESHKYEAEWNKQFTKLVQEKIENATISMNKSIDDVSEELNRRRNDYCKDNASFVSAERHLCNLCSKMFKGPNFVYNHIFNKHINLLEENVDKHYYDTLKYENYLKDPDKVQEKYKTIHSMEEYLQYLSTVTNVKSHQQEDTDKYVSFKKLPPPNSKYVKDDRREGRGRDNYRDNYRSNERDNDRNRDRDRDQFLKNKRFNRDFRDLDNPENKPKNDSRKLISYDDL